MSTSNSAENSSNISSGSGGQGGPNSQQRLADATQIVYSWLPHSKALGASSTVAIRVRNASLTNVGRPSNYQLNNATYNNNSSAVIHDEKKYNEEEEDDSVTPRGTPKHWHIFHIVARKR